MLTLYVFLIFALGSVIAIPTTRLDPQPYRVPWLLKDNIDRRLPAGLWGRLIVLDVRPGRAVPVPTWTLCDDFIKFISRYGFVKEISVHRVMRHVKTKQLKGLEAKYKYTVPRTGRTREVYKNIPFSKWGTFLHDTYWGRVPDVVGTVSDGVMIWNS